MICQFMHLYAPVYLLRHALSRKRQRFRRHGEWYHAKLLVVLRAVFYYYELGALQEKTVIMKQIKLNIEKYNTLCKNKRVI